MSKVIISEGKTTNEAIEKGLKELNTSRKNVEIKVLEQEKRSFFDILAPRVVKVEITMKDEEIHKSEKKQANIDISIQDLEKVKLKLENFIKSFLNGIDNSFQYSIKIENNNLNVNIEGEQSGTLIGYRGETLNALQSILTSIANNDMSGKIKVYLNIDNYKEKREKALEELAIKVSKTVLKNNKSITLEPMNAYERKIIHSKLQDMHNIRTHSIGEEPNRRIVIEKINK